MEQVSQKWLEWIEEHKVSDEWLAKKVDFLDRQEVYEQDELKIYFALAELLVRRGYYTAK